jgi:predicted DCC family thiol-disulfide oxidoreductase YuxK
MSAYPLTIYYDDSCPLCREEIFGLKAFDAQNRLRLVDCSVAGFINEETQKAGFTQQQLMRLIHAQDADGHWLIGIPVFEAAYQAAGIQTVAKTFANPMLRPFWDRLYPFIADNRYFLSKLGMNKAYGWWVRRTARKALARSQACKDGVCSID